MKNKILDAIYFIHNEGIITDDDLEFLLLNFQKIKEMYSKEEVAIPQWSGFVYYAWVWSLTTDPDRMKKIHYNCNAKFKMDRFIEFRKQFSVEKTEL